MLTVTRQEVEAFLEEWCLSHITDSSNETDAFLRNRLRHHVIPLLKEENPKLAENLSAMALRLRADEEALSQLAVTDEPPSVTQLRQLPPAVRARALEGFLKRSGVKEPEAVHLQLAESLVFSDCPSAKADFPGGVTITRNYDKLEVLEGESGILPTVLACPGITEIPQLGLRVVCKETDAAENTVDSFTVEPKGPMILRARLPGDTIRLAGGTKSLKKLFIDRKIPAAQRSTIPVIADDDGVLGVYGFGMNLDRKPQNSKGIQITFEVLP
jgi:tRNA(Ile)-lysidine synthase